MSKHFLNREEEHGVRGRVGGVIRNSDPAV